MPVVVSASFASVILAVLWAAAKFGALGYAATGMALFALALLALIVIVAIRGPQNTRAGVTNVSTVTGYRRRRSDRAAAKSR
jgi:hypothetical protein